MPGSIWQISAFSDASDATFYLNPYTKKKLSIYTYREAKMTIDNKFYFPIEKQIGGRVTRVTPGGSLMEKVKAARKGIGPMTEGLQKGEFSSPVSASDRYQSALDQVVSELNRLGISANVPYTLRRQADKFEVQIHQAAMAGDDRGFTQALEAWKKYFLEDVDNGDRYQQQPLFI